MKEKVRNNQENERKFYLSEFSYFDGEYDVTFNIVDMDFDRQRGLFVCRWQIAYHTPFSRQ